MLTPFERIILRLLVHILRAVSNDDVYHELFVIKDVSAMLELDDLKRKI